MFNFKKKETAPKEVLVADYPEIVHTIHREFNTAGEKLLYEAEAILADCKLKDKEKGKLLNALGFKNTPQAKEAIEIERKEKEAENNAKLVNYYSQKYPLNKFITEDIVKQICEKYGLVCGDVSLYKGFVPQSKLHEIANFKLRKEDEIPFTAYWLHGKWNEGSNNEARELVKWREEDLPREKVYYWTNPDFKVRIKEGLKICAPLKDMKTTGYELKGYKLEKHIPDPVVLQPVNGGYLIVTAWGNEASDENIVNQKMN